MVVVVATVIVPLDASELAERAVPYARSLAQSHNASVELLSVIDVPVEFSSWIGTSRLPDSSEVNQWLSEREQYLHHAASSYGLENVHVSATIGGAADNILEHSASTDDAVIVMASHGRTGFRRMVSGSVTVRVIRRAHWPVVVIPAQIDVEAPTIWTGKILVALDGSDLAEHALQSAVGALQLEGSHVRLVRVIETPIVTTPPEIGRPVSVDYGFMVEYEEASRREAERYLEDVSNRLTDGGIQVTWEVRDGDPADEIAAAATEQGSQLIAMATHGRGGFSRFAFGSVAESLLGDIQIPLFLRGPGHE